MPTDENAVHAGCMEFEEDLVLLHYGELGDAASEKLNNHLKSCTACRSSLDDLEALMPMTITRDQPPETFWSDYSRELRHKLDAVAEKRSWREQMLSWFRPIPSRAWAACAVLLIAVTLTVGQKYWQNSDVPGDDEEIAIISTSQDLDLLKDLEILDALDVLESMGADNA